jgi:LPPG:FO 2-phospho-L-lactate transferase
MARYRRVDRRDGADTLLAVHITALAGGIGAARFLLGLRAAQPDAEITAIVNTGDDIWVHGLRVCPDLDTVMYNLGGGISRERGWGREDETFVVKDELAAYGVEPTWFGLGDRDTATHLVRTQLLTAGYPLSTITTALCERWSPGITLRPMSDDRCETHVLVDDPDGGVDTEGRPLRKAIHFQEWWIRFRAALPAHGFVLVGIDSAQPGPGVLDAISQADIVLFPPSNPVVSIGTVLQVPGVREALAEATVIGVSPIIGSAPVHGMADACLTAIGVEVSARGVARHYGADLLDGWLIDESDAGTVADVEAAGIHCRAVPLRMTDVAATAEIARAALSLAETVR